MATTASARCADSAIPVYCADGVFCDISTYEASALTFAVADVIQMVKVAGADAPGGIDVLQIDLYTDDMGTCTAHVGDGTATSWAMANVDIGQAAGSVSHLGQGNSLTGSTGFPRRYTTDDTIDLTCASITGTITGTITMVVWMRAYQPAS